ncbi:MAG: MBL fold metallo-hydrolase [Oscillospiraceae bacterium]|jgi:glyoxylase-like metal-dependent hydrolase (beta-lactamase superfamily II)|nr:MBL fold metallo-hydrolase [Oscillospiraceae bacterium]
MDIKRIKIGSSNIYILQGNGSSVLIDSGGGGERKNKKLIRSLNKRGISPEDLKVIIITHAHKNQMGGALFFRRAYGTKIIADEKDSMTAKIKGRGIFGKIRAALAKNEKAGIISDIHATEGLRLAQFGIQATILSLPGHTCGSIGVLTDDGNLFCGGVMENFIFPSPSKLAQDFVLLNKSFIRLKMLPIKMVYPSNGRPFKFKRILKNKSY